MNTLITYIVVSVVTLGVFYTAYIAFLRNEPLFRFNRIYLLSSLFLSYLIPMISFIPDSLSPAILGVSGNRIIPTFTLSLVEIRPGSSYIAPQLQLILFVYIMGVTLFGSRLVIRLLSIRKLRNNSISANHNGIHIHWCDPDIPPFSFFQAMYLPAGLKDTLHLNEVIRHEQVHIKSLHSFDIVYTQIMQIICWVNPFIPLMEKSLREIHEFEADKAVIHAGADPAAYTKILFSQDKSALAVVLGNNFNYSLIKRRLTMFYKKNTRYTRLKAIVVLPIVASIAIVFAVSCRQATEPIAPPPPPPPPPPPTEMAAATDEVYTVVETMPQFPGGEEARIKYMINAIKYPEAAKKQQLQGTVYVSFIVEKDGSISDTKVLRGIGKLCDEEAIRVIEAMPKWTPGLQNGKTVRVKFTIPIQFKLN
jgi:TonB family protein